MTKHFSEELHGIEPDDNVVSSNVNPMLKRLVMNTINNKEKFEDWLNEPVLENDLKVNAGIRSEKTTEVKDVNVDGEGTVNNDLETDELNTDENIYLRGKHILEHLYPIGSIYFSTTQTNPQAELGIGEWRTFNQGTGRVLVGIDQFNSNFNILGLRGGEKAVRLTNFNLPSHDHDYSVGVDGDTSHRHTFTGTYHSNKSYAGKTGSWSRSAISWRSRHTFHTNYAESEHEHQNTYSNNTGGGRAHNNLQPYITVYIWIRVA